MESTQPKSRQSISSVPTEILSKICREATLVPEALDTSPSIFFEDREVVVQLVCESMTTKRSLSVVSKAFHNVMETYLYEIVMIFRFDYVPILLERLKSAPPGFRIPRGHRCRRIDFYLGVRESHPYRDDAWYEGGHTLWGLVPACPNLEILTARVVRTRAGGDAPHLTHKSLWKIIATHCSRSLRRLEVYGFQIRMDRVEMMLRYLSKLEACRIIHATCFDPDNDVYDDEEPTERLIVFDQRNCHRSVAMKDNWDYSMSSGWFDTATVSEFKAAKENSQWPPFATLVPYTLPLLHTLRLDRFDSKLLQQFNFPRLRHLDITLIEANDSEEETSKVCGPLPTSLTHLVYAGDSITIDSLCPPNLQYLTLSIENCDFASVEFNEPHPNLEVIELAIWTNTLKPDSFVKGILDAVSENILSGLRMIQITRYLRESSRFRPPRDSEAFGVAIKEVHRRQPLLSGFEMRH